MKFSREELLACFRYDPETGLLYRRERPLEDFSSEKEWKRYNTKDLGNVAGSRLYTVRGSRSKIQLSHKGVVLSAHRIIWAMVYGEIDSRQFIDHINGDPFDNRLCNLRISDYKSNQWNRLAPKNSSTGLVGVRPDAKKGAYRAFLRTHGKVRHSSYYPTKGLAAVARAKMSLKYHGKYSPYYRTVANPEA